MKSQRSSPNTFVCFQNSVRDGRARLKMWGFFPAFRDHLDPAHVSRSTGQRTLLEAGLIYCSLTFLLSLFLFYYGALCYQLYQAPTGTFLPQVFEPEWMDDALWRSNSSIQMQMFSQMTVRASLCCHTISCMTASMAEIILKAVQIIGLPLEKLLFRCCKLLQGRRRFFFFFFANALRTYTSLYNRYSNSIHIYCLCSCILQVIVPLKITAWEPLK